MTGLRVAVIGPMELPKVQGGMTRHCEEIYARLAAEGDEITMICGPGATTEATYRGMKVRKVRTFGGRGWERLTYSFQAARAAMFGPYDIVHFHSFASSGFCVLPKLTRRKIVVTVHRLEWRDQKWSGFARRFLRWSEWSAVRFADRLIAVSAALRDDVVARHSRARDMVVIPNGVFEPLPVGEEPLAPLGLRRDRFLVCVGRLVPEKGLETVIDAFLALPADAVDDTEARFDLVIVGAERHGTSYTEALQTRAAPAGERVHFVGLQTGDTLHALFRHSRAFVAGAFEEGQPLTVLEAMSHGCCIVASDIAPHVELLDGVALLFPVGDVDALLSELGRVTADATLARRLGDEARARLASRPEHSWDRVAEQTHQVLLSS